MKRYDANRVPRPGRGLTLAVLGICVCSTSPVSAAGLAKDPRAAIVKIYTVGQAPDYEEAWNPGMFFSSTGSGCVIGGNRILTAAHVVSHARFIEVRRHGQAERHEARVLHVSHAADLALLAVDDGFFEGIAPLEVGDLPYQADEVIAYGFPSTGDRLSITRGVVSRIEHSSYVHSGRSLLAIQIDAAINAGSSGGPVLSEGRVVGVAMQADSNAENSAEIVPSPTVRRFLDDVEDGSYDGIPELGIHWQAIENEALRRRHGMADSETGVLVNAVLPGSSADSLLRRGDIVMSIDGVPVAGDGTVEFRGGERTDLSWLIERRQMRDAVEVAYLRDGDRSTLDLVLDAPAGRGALIPYRSFDGRPRYFIFGGVVFVPLTYDYLETWEDWVTDAPDALTIAAGKPASEAGEEVVVLTRVLSARLNEGYSDLYYRAVDSVDGRKVKNLAHLVQLIDGGRDPFVTIVHSRGEELVLDRARVMEGGAQILEEYGIDSDRSPDLENPLSPPGGEGRGEGEAGGPAT